MDVVRDKLMEKLRMRDGGLLGCHRRNIWMGDSENYRMLRGNAVLKWAGRMWTVRSPMGPLDFVTHPDDNAILLTFRAGPWKDYWLEDMFLLWSLVVPHMELKSEIVCIHENKGEITTRTIHVPDFLDPAQVVALALQSITSFPVGRLAKNTSRSYHVCRFCPVKQRCDATDVAEGADDDWGPGYPIP